MSDAGDSSSATEAKRPRDRCASLAVVIAVVWAIATLLADFASPRLDAGGTFAVAWALAATLLQATRGWLAISFLIAAIAHVRRRKTAALLVVASLVGICPEIRHAWPARADDSTVGTPLRVISLNDETSLKNVSDVVGMIRAKRPDVLAIEQLAAGADAAIHPAVADFLPYRAAFPSPPFQRIAIYSRWPTRVTRAPDFHDDAHGRIVATEIDVGGRAIRVIAVHLTSPRRLWRMRANRDEALALVRLLGTSDLPTIVVGDFNAPLGSPTVEALRAAGLTHTDDRAGGGLRWTWMPRHMLPMTRIDHAFVSPHFGVVDSRVLGRVGSDHLPIAVDLRLR